MAGKAAKKQLSENQKALAALRYGFLISNAVYILLRLAFFYDSVSLWHVVGLLLCDLVLFFSYNFFDKQAKPTYEADGQLAYGGGDLGSGGINEYVHDVIYVIWFVLVASSLSDYFWFVLLVIPGYALFKLPGLYKKLTGGGMPQPQADAYMDEKARKKQEKAERQQARMEKFRR